MTKKEQNMWKGISEKDKIEQIIWDPELGIVKREIHIGIIDYYTTFNLRKRLEDKLEALSMKQAPTIKPEDYAQRFWEFTESIFK